MEILLDDTIRDKRDDEIEDEVIQKVNYFCIINKSTTKCKFNT